MRTFVLFMAVVCAFTSAIGAEEKVLTPAEAAKHEGKDETVTVEFVVKHVIPVIPDGKHVRLFSTRSFIDKDSFVVHLTDEAVAKMAGKDLEAHYVGQKIRVTGKVGPIIFSSTSKTRPGIFVDDPPRVILEK